MLSHQTRIKSFEGDSTLLAIIDQIAHLLPSQGPIRIFIHHNPLHAFEHLNFEEAALLARNRFGYNPFLSEDQYRAGLNCGRITTHDLDACLGDDLGDRGKDLLAGEITRYDLRRRIVLHGFPNARSVALSWMVNETSAVERFRADLPDDVREATNQSLNPKDVREESVLVRSLWESCLNAVRRSIWQPKQLQMPTENFRRYRDLLYRKCHIDTDEWIHPLLIRFVAAYLDQDYAHWPMPNRDQGMYQCFLDIYGTKLIHLCGPWSRYLRRYIAEERKNHRTSLSSIECSLLELEVPKTDWQDFLEAEVVALRGWAGMICQVEQRPDRVPSRVVPAKLVDFIAVRLLLTKAAITYAKQKYSSQFGSLAELRHSLAIKTTLPSPMERAWPLFHAAQLCGLSSADINEFSGAAIGALEEDLSEFDSMLRQRIFHRAYERHLKHRFYDALVGHTFPPEMLETIFQAVFCIDEREESIRRHLEEVEPNVETFGAAGFFGLAMYFRGARDAHPRPLCPIAIQPKHYIKETHNNLPGFKINLARIYNQCAALVGKNVHVGSRTFMAGTALMATVGVITIIPMVLRVLFPWLRQRFDRINTAGDHNQTKLAIARDLNAAPPIGDYVGFTLDEMVEIVYRLLISIGIKDRLSSLVFIVGHGSVSLNNPHESAHDCGACGGGRGGPNARAFAQMANDPHVRLQLAKKSLVIPKTTWFIGAERNTADNSVSFFDDDLIPAHLKQRFAQAKSIFEIARAREAHERCRRFQIVPSWFTTRQALHHVESRAADLAQPRPEYGHATNAFCVVGRRIRTRGLFLDRRAFLISYDPTTDSDGRILEQLLAAVVPVVAGINLEYFFGYMDPTGYGSGTKLPHNVTSLLGVMDGAQSDLRTGLPWQMLEIHEPVRLSLVIESGRDRLIQVLQANADFRQLVNNKWLFLACLDPHSNQLLEVDGEVFKPYQADHPLHMIKGGSLLYYRGKRGHLPFVGIEADKYRKGW